MKLCFRWHGKDDPVSLAHIRQIPCMKHVVSSLSFVPVGDVWKEKEIEVHRDYIQRFGMLWSVVESLPLHEEIKWGGPQRDRYIEQWLQSMRNLARCGLFVVCYNFMPICDWMRTRVRDSFEDGSHGLSYYQKEMDDLRIEEVAKWNLTAWDSHTESTLQSLQASYRKMTEESLRENLQYFLQVVVPEAEREGVKLAIHPDDPPWSIFGLPRIVKNATDIQEIMGMVDSTANGLTFCTGSLGADAQNELVPMILQWKDRIHFAHCRNVETVGKKDFREVAHAIQKENTLSLSKILRAYKDIAFTGYMRPDHGRMIWKEEGTEGYGLYDRALAAMYLQGLWDAE